MRKAAPPVWVMGLTGTTYGLIGGFVAFVLPQALAARNVPETIIASLTAVALSPGFWAFIFSPALDVRFSRRTYALALIVITALLVGASVFLLDRLAWLEVVATAAFFVNQLYYSALGGWLSTACSKADENRLSAWLTVANVGGFGVMAVVGGELLRNAAPLLSAILLALLALLPAVAFIGIPVRAPDGRLAKESFQAFFGDVVKLLRRRDVWFAVLLFIAPCATFSLTNLLGGLGGDFSASPRQVGILGGAATAIAGVCGSFLLPPLAKRMRLRPLYLAIGVVGSLYTVTVLLLPRDLAAFALAVVGENVFQGLAIACSTALAFETIGRHNPLAATNFGVLVGAYNVPISYMLIVDGWGYDRWGLVGAFGADAGVGILACTVMAVLLRSFNRSATSLSAKQPA
jgi:PAT family beta-lactamase induction signal transducer AmpG